MTRPQDNLEAKDSRVKVGTTADWLYRINQASVVSNLEEGLLSPELAQALATALFSMQKDEHEGKIAPAQTYIAFEPEMLNRAGMNASVIHIGRSSQDILATVNAGLNKERPRSFSSVSSSPSKTASKASCISPSWPTATWRTRRPLHSYCSDGCMYNICFNKLLYR